ncbi:MAG: PfkB family carbohydrate kinase [Proteobacteria bacterium]|nr:PfkB family carbohydrate kinase [Pseudomonadota bacterium]
MNNYDLVFVGHVTIDDIEAAEGSSSGVPGGAPFFGALAAAPTKKKIAVITKMSGQDEYILTQLKAAGVDVFLLNTPETTHMRVVHQTDNMDERLIYQTKNAGFFEIEQMPSIESRLMHLGALTDQEFTLEFIRQLRSRTPRLSMDMQNIVRQVDRTTGVIHFKDAPVKKEMTSLVDAVKLDVVEAEILTGTDDLHEAAAIVEGWGSAETMITRSDGVFVRYRGQTYFEKYSNKSAHGRTGRGDTTMGAYLAWRIDHDVHESLRFAVALASIKMETPGPFRGSLDDVLARMS